MWAFVLWGRRYLIGNWPPPWPASWTPSLRQAFVDFALNFEVWTLLAQADAIPGSLLDLPPCTNLETIDSVPRSGRAIEAHSWRYHSQDELVRSLEHVQRGDLVTPSAVPVMWNGHGPPALIIVHCFAGRRRPHDVHHWLLEAGQAIFPEFTIFPLSLDTAICHISGDLLSSFVLQAVEELCGLSAVALCLTGPPCETWSAARFLDLPSDSHCRRAPRPVRSLQSPWGLADLSLRELAQVHLSNQLLWNSLYIETLVLLQGGGALMEHPAPSPCQEHPSVWRTTAHREVFDRLHAAVHHRVEQWQYGARCRKPTTLRAANLPGLGVRLKALVDPHAMAPSVVLGGRHRDGTFKTAMAKEYPPDFCRAIAVSTLSSLRDRMQVAGCRVVDADQLTARSKMWYESVIVAGAHCTRDTFLPDYQPK